MDNRISIAFSRVFANASLGLHDRRRGAVTRRRSSFDLKEIQRRAFERGREVEREQGTGPLQQTLKALREAGIRRDEEFARDAEKVEEFAVRLALKVAEDVIGRAIEESDYDVGALVKKSLEEVRDRKASGPLRIEAGPADAGRLLDSLAADKNSDAGSELEVTETSSLAPGQVRICGEGTEYWASMTERLESLRHRLLEESRDV